MTTIQIILNIGFTVLFFGALSIGILLLWRIWQTLIQLLAMMQETIIENSKRNTDTIHHLSEMLGERSKEARE